MHSDEYPVGGAEGAAPEHRCLPAVGTPLGPWVLELRAAANDRYWAGAGIDHPARGAGVLYPPLAANLLIVALQRVCDEPLLHLAQRLRTHATATAPATVRLSGSVRKRWEHRGREHLEVVAEVVAQGPGAVTAGAGGRGTLLWEGSAHFCTARRRPAPRTARVMRGGDGRGADRERGEARTRPGSAGGAGAGAGVRRRSLRLEPELLRTYSRRGNFHSEPELAARLGYPAPVAQGMQVAAPAYGLLLEAWEDALLRDAEVHWTFHRPVVAGRTVTALAQIGPDAASFTVGIDDESGAPEASRAAVSGRARLHPDRPGCS